MMRTTVTFALAVTEASQWESNPDPCFCDWPACKGPDDCYALGNVEFPCIWELNNLSFTFQCQSTTGPHPSTRTTRTTSSCPLPTGTYSQSCYHCTTGKDWPCSPGCTNTSECELRCLCDRAEYGYPRITEADLRECSELANVDGVLTCTSPELSAPAQTSPAPAPTLAVQTQAAWI